jgi:hypothetical protein
MHDWRLPSFSAHHIVLRISDITRNLLEGGEGEKCRERIPDRCGVAAFWFECYFDVKISTLQRLFIVPVRRIYSVVLNLLEDNSEGCNSVLNGAMFISMPPSGFSWHYRLRKDMGFIDSDIAVRVC